MAVRFPLYPYDLGRNKVYLYLIDQYAEGVRQWEVWYLRARFGDILVDQLVDYKILTVDLANPAMCKMSFDDLGSVSHLISELVSEEVRSFKEILREIPRRSRVTIAALKNLISFLANFNKIQFFTLPCSTFTCIAAEDSQDLENQIDEIFNVANYLEKNFVYRINSLDGADELKDLSPEDSPYKD